MGRAAFGIVLMGALFTVLALLVLFGQLTCDPPGRQMPSIGAPGCFGACDVIG